MTKLHQYKADVPRRRRDWIVSIPAAVAALSGLTLPTACTFDPNDRCGVNQVIHGDNEICVCAPGYTLVGTSCVPCGANEVSGATGCVCAPGYLRSNASGACEPKPVGQGTDCDATNACSDATQNYCQMSGSKGYCTTKGCTSSADCVGGYACDLSATPSYCKRPPVGVDKTCSSAADCAGTEATYCDTSQSHMCLVEGCSLSPNSCFPGTECCDLSAYSIPKPLCIPQGACQK